MKIRSLTDINSIALYLRRIGAEERSLRAAVVKEQSGNYWRDVAVINFSTTGEVDAPEHYMPTELEQRAIEDECKGVDWPKLKLLPRLLNLPDELAKAPTKDLFEFRNVDGDIVMLQLRIDGKGAHGQKRYVPWTYWDDDLWRKMEPDGKLPLWGLEQLKNHTTVFIHEGAKAASAVKHMVAAQTPAMRAKLAAHPWGEELANAAHLGWIGGALSPYRTDWKALQAAGVNRAYIVSDNDAPGVAAVPSIAYHLRMPTFHLQFTSEWPASFDLADEFPRRMFSEIEGREYYTGPSFRACLHPATWATDQIPNKRGKPTVALRKSFAEMFAYVEQADMFACIEMPEIVRGENIINKMLSGFSHTNRTSDLMVKNYRGRSVKFCYRPDIAGRIVTAGETSAINLHTPTTVKAMPGDVKPWLDFMAYMFPNKTEMNEVLRWCATLIARPDLRMEYGLLLVSVTQGIGKEQPLDAKILTPTGWSTMGDMRVGKVITGADGRHQAVIGVYPQGVKSVYKVTFSDGTSVECGLDHNWKVRVGNSVSEPRWSVKTTRELMAAKCDYRIPIASPVLMKVAELPIEPYLLGALIGDGYLCGPGVAISIPEDKAEVLEKCKTLLSNEYVFEETHPDAPAPQHYIRLKEKQRNPNKQFKAKMAALGLDVKSGERFIPEAYKLSSIYQRTELLRGLMDTDGTSTNGRTHFSSSSERLARDVCDIVRSLGGVAYLARYEGTTSDEWRVNVRTNFAPFSLPRKLARWKPATKEYGNRIVSIEYAGEKEQQCISVSSPDHCYVTDNYKVTHNTTLGAGILSPLVGNNNTGFPTEQTIVQSDFNGWLANKRLVIIGEIYSGHSWKAYNKLKSVITDKDVEVNEKYQRTYNIENWAHVFACSNSMRALRMEEDDRRWYYPEVNEEKWPREKFIAFHGWLKSGGISMIKAWADNFGDYVLPGQPAPMTERKKALIDDSRSEAQQEAARLAEAITDYGQPVAMGMKAVVGWVRGSVQGRVFDSDADIRKAMKSAGVYYLADRVTIGGMKQYVALNGIALDHIREQGYTVKVLKGNATAFDETKKADALGRFLQSMVKQPTDILGETM